MLSKDQKVDLAKEYNKKFVNASSVFPRPSFRP